MVEQETPLPRTEPVTLDADRIVRWLFAAVALLALAHLALIIVAPWLGLGPERLRNLRRFVDLGAEANLPTWFSALGLSAAGALLAWIAHDASRRVDPLRRHWWGLVVALFFLGADEAALIHDGLVGPAIANWAGRGSGIWHYGWYKAYLPLLAILGWAYLRFLWRIPRATARDFLVAAGVYLLGAVGLEMLESRLVAEGQGGVEVSRLFEETAEMAGIVLAIRALLHHIARERLTLPLQVRSGAR